MSTINQSYRKVVGSEVRFSLPYDSSCPCGSKVPANKCCLSPSGFFKQPCNTTPKGKVTGISREKCYANSLNDCCKKLSGEHYISQNLLHHLNINNSLSVSGFSWTGTDTKTVPPSALASNILCERHNNILSGLDSIALKLFHALDESDLSDTDDKELLLFSGHDLERWLLKTLCGLIASKSLALTDDVERGIQREWLEILYGKSEFSGEAGLYICKTTGHTFSGAHGVEAQAIVKKGKVSGLGLKICGYELVFSMTGFPTRVFDSRDFAYRPLELYAIRGKYEKSVVFSWEGAADLGTITLNLNK
ncbi:MAG: hypothetical protein OEY07_04805 [Gammaproteobacteria bacterium]|nr:hypothetical protein [Gammaproteobacteria bacterium]